MTGHCQAKVKVKAPEFCLFSLSAEVFCGISLCALKVPSAGHLWLTPVIPATQEAEIRRIEVRSQPQANTLQEKMMVEWLKW
jgi:hypothetical protein